MIMIIVIVIVIVVVVDDDDGMYAEYGKENENIEIFMTRSNEIDTT